jgi:hypothetical protein
VEPAFVDRASRGGAGRGGSVPVGSELARVEVVKLACSSGLSGCSKQCVSEQESPVLRNSCWIAEADSKSGFLAVGKSVIGP